MRQQILAALTVLIAGVLLVAGESVAEREHAAVVSPDRHLAADARINGVHRSDLSTSPSPTVPEVPYATFLGGSGGDEATGVAMDSEGRVYVVGSTDSVDFPGATPERTWGSGDEFTFVIRFDADRALDYVALVGGTRGPSAVTTDTESNVYVTGATSGQGAFPATAGAYDTGCGDFDSDVFVLKLDPEGALSYATCVGGPREEGGADIVVDVSGNAYVTGGNAYGYFPTTVGAYDRTYNGGMSSHNAGDAFLFKLNHTGSSLLYSTYLGGSDPDSASGLVVDESGYATVVGVTSSLDFPRSHGAFGGAQDLYIARFTPSGGSLSFSAVLGGSKNEGADMVAMGPGDTLYVAGDTASSDFPTTFGAFSREHQGLWDAFVVSFSTSTRTFGVATLLGGASADFPKDIGVDATGNVYLVGSTSSEDFPIIPGALHTSYGGGFSDGFFVKLDPGLGEQLYGTYLGGSERDSGNGIIVSAVDEAEIVGRMDSPEFVTSEDAFDRVIAGESEGFLLSAALTCSPANTRDSDKDGLLDAWEICGYYHDGTPGVDPPDVDLAAMGADPTIPDIFVEIDYMSNQRCAVGDCRVHSHRPKDGAIEAVVNTFDNRGIHLHVDYGEHAPLTWGAASEWGQLSDGELLDHQETINEPDEVWDEVDDWPGFDRIKEEKFQEARERIFHYAIFAHALGGRYRDQPVPLSVSGWSRNRRDSSEAFRSGASDFVVSLGCFNSETVECEGPQVGTELQQAGTFMHELGHNLGLAHGGDDGQNYEPNFLSVMNYSYQTDGLIQRQPDNSYIQGVLDYSIFASGIPDLNEDALDESAGMGGAAPFDFYGLRYFCQPPEGVACPENSEREGGWCSVLVEAPNDQEIDWNCDGEIDSGVRASINDGDDRTRPDPEFDTLDGNYYEWDLETLSLDGGQIGINRPTEVHSELSETSANSDHETFGMNELRGDVAATFYRPYAISIGPSVDVVASAGESITVPVALTNIGDLTTTVELSNSSPNNWFDLDAVPLNTTLIPGGVISFPVGINVPDTAVTGELQRASLNALLPSAPLMGDTMMVEVRVGLLARFDASSIKGTVPHTVTFTDTSVGNISTWSWEFGDGFQSTVPNPTHVYEIPGVYTVSLTVSGPDGTDVYERPNLVRAHPVRTYLPLIRD